MKLGKKKTKKKKKVLQVLQERITSYNLIRFHMLLFYTILTHT